MTSVLVRGPLWRFLFWTAWMFAVFRELGRRRELAQHPGELCGRHLPEHRPVGYGDRNHHAIVRLADLQRQIIARHLVLALLLPMGTSQCRFNDGHGVVRDQREAK